MGRPRPRPIPPGGPPSPPACGFLIVSSTESIRQVASDAAIIAFILTTDGSQTNASKLSAISSFRTSTPYHFPPEK